VIHAQRRKAMSEETTEIVNLLKDVISKLNKLVIQLEPTDKKIVKYLQNRILQITDTNLAKDEEKRFLIVFEALHRLALENPHFKQISEEWKYYRKPQDTWKTIRQYLET
jgi:TRAP-type mannitol/chloroaromatic compound transport system substrate-binding protein